MSAKAPLKIAFIVCNLAVNLIFCPVSQSYLSVCVCVANLLTLTAQGTNNIVISVSYSTIPLMCEGHGWTKNVVQYRYW